MQGDLPASRAFHERALVIAREVGNIYQENYTLINLSAVTGIQQTRKPLLPRPASAELSRKNGERSERHGLCYIWATDFNAWGILKKLRPLSRIMPIRFEWASRLLLNRRWPHPDPFAENEGASALMEQRGYFHICEWRHSRRDGRAASNYSPAILHCTKQGSARRRPAQPAYSLLQSKFQAQRR